MSRRIVSFIAILALLATLAGTVQARPAPPAASPQALVQITLAGPADLDRFAATGLPAHAFLDGGAGPSILAAVDPAGLDALARAGLAHRVLDPDIAAILKGRSPERLYLAYPLPNQPHPTWEEHGRVLLDEGPRALLRTRPTAAARLARIGVEMEPLPPTPITLPAALPVRLRPALVEPDPHVQAMMDQVISSTVYQYDGDLSGEWPALIGGEPYTINTRYTYSGEPLRKATQFVGEHLENLGLDVEYHVWNTISNPNVIGEIPGIVHPEEIYLISAHLDDTSEQPYTYAPGADDNASGATALLIAADILSQYDWGCTLRFALFTGEEQGLLGSNVYARRSRLIGEDIRGVLNLDMIAWNTPQSSADIDLHAKALFTPTIEMAELFSDVVSVYDLDLIPEIWPVGSGGSDHSSFWIRGYPAILAIEDFGDFNPYYHTTSDQLEHLDIAYFTEFVKASLGTFVHMNDCLITAGLGFADGHVVAADGGAPIEGATLTFQDELGWSMFTWTDVDGYYTRTLPTGAYTATAWAYGYLPSSAGITILTDTVTTQDFTLTTAPDYVVSGTVSEAGTGRPLYAQVTVLGTPLAPAWTDPATGSYSLTIAAGSYTFHVTATAHHAADQTVIVDANRTQDFALTPYSCILLVDDDQYSPDVLPYYSSALDALGLAYDLWDTNDGNPTPNQLCGHRMVFWFTARTRSEVFTRANEEAIAAYLDDGGRFLLSSVDYLFYAHLTPFGQDYLGIETYTSDVSLLDTVGNPGNPVGDGLGPFYLVPPPGWRPPIRTDAVEGQQASPFRWESSGQSNSTNYTRDNFRTVFLAWPLEGLDDVQDRAAVLERVVGWLGGCGPDGRLEGHASEALGGAPLAGVTLTVSPGAFQTSTDEGGYYSFTLSAGPYDLTAEKAGYLSRTVAVTVTGGHTTTQDFALEPLPACIPVTEADFTWEPLSPTAGQVVTFTGSASGTAPITYSWDLGNGDGEPGSVITTTYDLPGVYTVTMTATNCTTATATVMHTVTVALACRPVRMAKFAWEPLAPAVGQVITFHGWSSGGWISETIDHSGNVGTWSSLALDADDLPHISYMDLSHLNLKYAYLDGATWISETVDDGEVGDFTSLALDAAGRPHISYAGSSPHTALKHAWFDGTSWFSETVDSAYHAGPYGTIALDAMGRPHISYPASGTAALRYAYYDGSRWYTETVDENGGRYSSLALNGAGQPAISYVDWDGHLKYAHYDGSSWYTETVDSSAPAAWTSLALDTADHPHTSYYDPQNHDLKYAWHGGSTWRIETVDSTGWVGLYTSLRLDSDNRPCISYHDLGHENLKYAWNDGTGWRTETVESIGHVGLFTSLALDRGGQAHIAHYDWTSEDLKYARQLPAPSPPISYTWSFGDGSPVAIGPSSITHTYTLPGAYTVTLTAANACGEAVAVQVVTAVQRIYLPLALPMMGLDAAGSDQVPPLLWQYDLYAPSFGSAAVGDIDDDGKPEIVFGTYFEDEHAYALNAEDGSLKWRFDGGGGPLDASAAIADVNLDGHLEVLVAASWGIQYCLDGEGNELWRYPTSGYIECIDSPPAVADVDDDGRPEVIFGAWYGKVYVLNGEDGSLVWDADLGANDYIQSQPAVLDVDGDTHLDIVVASFSDAAKVWALRGYDGHLLWDFQAGDNMYHGPAFADIDEDGKPELAITCYDGYVYVINAEDGSERWKYQTGQTMYSPVALGDLDNDAHLELVASGHSGVVVLSHTGGLEWSYPTAGPAFRGAAITDVNGDGWLDIAFGSDDHTLRVLKGVDGSVIWSWNLGGDNEIDHVPVLADFDGDGDLDLFFVAGYWQTPNNHGQAYALDTGDGVGASWPMFAHDLRHSGLFSGTFAHPPTLAGVSPNSGPDDQPTDVTILGSHFQPTPTARLDGTVLLDMTYVSSTTLTATVPAGMAIGVYTMTLTNPDGQWTYLTEAFTVTSVPPVVTSIIPNSGPSNAPTDVAIGGAYFHPGATARLDGIALLDVTCVSSTTLTATVQAGMATGIYTLTVSNIDGQSGMLADAFTVTAPAPALMSITPNSGPSDAPTDVTILGAHFQPTPTARLNGTALLDVTCVSSTTLGGTVPAGMAVGVYTLTVTNPDQQSATLTDAFTVTYPPPEVTSITPNSGPSNVPTDVTILGAHFLPAPTARLDGTALLDLIYVSSTMLSGTVPAGMAVGVYTLTVSNTDGQSGILTDAFTVTYPPLAWRVYLPLVEK